MPTEPQALERHGKMVPLYHRAITLLVVAALALSIPRIVQDLSIDTAESLVLTVALLLTAWFARAFPPVVLRFETRRPIHP